MKCISHVTGTVTLLRDHRSISCMHVYLTYDKFSFNKNSLVDIILNINIRTCWSVTETFQC